MIEQFVTWTCDGEHDSRDGRRRPAEQVVIGRAPNGWTEEGGKQLCEWCSHLAARDKLAAILGLEPVGRDYRHTEIELLGKVIEYRDGKAGELASLRAVAKAALELAKNEPLQHRGCLTFDCMWADLRAALRAAGMDP